MYRILQALFARLTASVSTTLQRSVAGFFHAAQPFKGPLPRRHAPLINRLSDSVGRGSNAVMPSWTSLLARAMSRRNGFSPWGPRPTQSNLPDRSRPSTSPPASSRSNDSRTPARAQPNRNTSGRGRNWWHRLTRAFTAPARASRARERVQQRYQSALAAVRSSRPTRRISPSATDSHRTLVSAALAARRRMAAVGALNAKATGSAAAASGRVATALLAVGGKLAGFAGLLAAPLAFIGTAIKLPSLLARWGDARIDRLRRNGDFQGQVGAAAMRYDVTTQNLRALSARDTVESTNRLVNQQNRLRKALRPWGDWFQNRISDFQASLAGGVANLLGGLTEATEWAEVVGGEAAHAAAGRGVDPQRARRAKNQAERDREEKQRAENQVFDQPLSRTLRAWVDAIDNKHEARINRRPKPPLKPLQ